VPHASTGIKHDDIYVGEGGGVGVGRGDGGM